jgi:hypothetical protein
MAGTDTDTTICSRCSATFGCGARAGGCWCADVMLDDVVRADVARFYGGCLCPSCLGAIEETRPARPSVGAFLKKNLRRRATSDG